MVGPRPATSTTATTSAASATSRSKSCFNFSNPITWAGRRKWRRRSWATRTGRNSGEELTNSFCRTDPEIAKAFARVTFTSDNRGDLASVDVPTLILQCSEDIIASPGSRRVRPSRYSEQRDGHPGSDRPLPQSQRAGRSHLRHAHIRLSAPLRDLRIDDFEDMFENAPCGYITLLDERPHRAR